VCQAFAGEALRSRKSLTETLNAYEQEKAANKKERQQSHSLQTARIQAT
jgi:hypothetical protein